MLLEGVSVSPRWKHLPHYGVHVYNIHKLIERPHTDTNNEFRKGAGSKVTSLNMIGAFLPLYACLLFVSIDISKWMAYFMLDT